MQVILLSLLFMMNSSLTKTPNFYPNYIAAKEASKNYNKDLLLFFTKKSCEACDVAWQNFENDPIAGKIYISTSMDIQNFDGAVFLDKYGLKNAPSWVILDPQGKVKDKWEGEWKKTPTRPATPKPGEIDKHIDVENKITATAGMQSNEMITQETIVDKALSPVIEITTIESQEKDNQTKTEKEDDISSSNQQMDTTTPNPKTPNTPNTDEEPFPVSTKNLSSGFVIQAGYFSSAGNASRLVSELKAKGFESFFVRSTVKNGNTFHRVISASFNTEADAKNEVEVMKVAGIITTVKNQKEI